ncbi:hypothetical protein LI90_775 [Carbonactinospora thermoautotrophica]|uniref:Uncharacterized protein n=1 Tax=Carbonactinospora thermoautotrophica TaxID=1469144 RepID=A0A132MP04_9ACTN|nr:hypothetical protein [Carbonactinospora thermoautotrophica]KWW99141.1 hypothetical protein LI90_775 [Carbonactinospora thermoautotrophica]
MRGLAGVLPLPQPTPAPGGRGIGEGFFARERTRAWAGVVFYAIAGTLGYLIAPPVALAIFLALPIFYGITSQGLTKVPDVVCHAMPER